MSRKYVASKHTTIGTEGETGQSRAVVEKAWTCTSCKAENSARRPRCFRCKAKKPKNSRAIVPRPPKSKWKEAFDPATNLIYYFNTETQETTWDRPKEMGRAPHATGWFGRGRAGAKEKYEKLNEEYLKRKARKQVDAKVTRGYQRTEGANEYNIWYGKYIGDHWKNNKGVVAAEHKCIVAKDSGWTKADKANTKSYFCYHFARGQCARGHECNFYHRIPTAKDEAQIPSMKDVFGREMHSEHRDDMGGVGSFKDNCRTLYVGGLTTKDNLKKILWKEFGEFGEVENINLIHRLMVAFVRYRLRSNAQFAKAAMSGQNLGGDEILNIRWAYEDPNPIAKKAIKRSNQDAIIAKLKAQGVSDTAAGFEYPATYNLPAPKRRRIGNGDEESAYPDTDRQYAAVPYQPTPAPYNYTAAPYNQQQHMNYGPPVTSSSSNSTSAVEPPPRHVVDK